MRNLLLLLVFAFGLGEANAQGWLTRADFGGVGRHRGTGMCIGNKGYAGLGHMNGTGVNIVYKDWWQFDPASNSWTQKADYPAPMYGAIAWGNSTHGYVGGGTAYSFEYFKYDPITNTWTAIANCPIDATDQTAFSVAENGYVMTGNQLVEYNPSSNSWSTKANVPAGLGAWGTSFVIGSSAFVKNGVALYEYKPAQNEWLVRSSCPGIATGGSSAFSMNQRGYIISGYSGSLSLVTKEIWEYNPATNTWQQLDDFPGSARRFSVGFSINDRGYFGLGTNGINFNDFWAYDRFAGVDEMSKLNCEIYPNPSTDFIQISISESQANLNYELINVFGKQIGFGELSCTATSIDIQPLEAGTYFVRIFNEKGQSITKQIQKTN